jgi:hypothetical protein
MRPPILPPVERDDSWPNETGSGYLYGDRPTCRTCGRNLRRHESELGECYRCEESPAPLDEEREPRRGSYGCGCK